MPEVTINAADLEALLFAAGCANANPEAKKLLRRDPQFEQVEGRLTDAIKRAGDSWRKAGRADAFPERFSVDEQEIAYLKSLAEKGAVFRLGMVEPMNDTVPRSYVTKMLVEYGIYAEQVTWTTSGDNDQMNHAERRVRLTADARRILEARYAGNVSPVIPMELPAPQPQTEVPE